MSERTRADIMHDIEGRHFGRCIDQLWGAGRRTLVELMDYPKAKRTVIVVKHFETSVPKSGSSKPWPDLTAVGVYVPVEDDTNSWTGIDEALTKLEAATK
jgi:hypothetical protein